jgi:predicted TIM-barrel fold metal-dependent hydrolase
MESKYRRSACLEGESRVKFDGHIHIEEGKPDPQGLVHRLAESGQDGGLLISLPPPSFPWLSRPASYTNRLENLLEWTGRADALEPFFWIDPTDDDAEEQVHQAVGRGVAGFKVICNHYCPGDRRALVIFRMIAQQRKPILFHSGILWDGQNSSRYNRPAEFEALLDVKGLVFSMAHMGWPWVDEFIAVYGKFLNASSLTGELAVEMFIDITPGTPPIYRREALSRLFGVGYDLDRNVIFGSDCSALSYNAEWTQQWIARDTAIYEEIGVSRDTVQAVFGGNLKRFLNAEHLQHSSLRSAE